MCCNREIVSKNSTEDWLKYRLIKALSCGTLQQIYTTIAILKNKRIKLLSNYMMHILVMRLFMLPKGIRQIRFRDTCAEATNFWDLNRFFEMRCYKWV